ncbi:MAG: phage tail assembly chaperone [Sphingomonadales bacterium]|nr:phage tail assembly chaperone [Sphingomonadales bacterium]
MGALNWSPNNFWQATPHEVRLGLEGWKKTKGITSIDHSLTKADLLGLMERYPD